MAKKEKEKQRDRVPRGELLLLDPDEVLHDGEKGHPEYSATRAKKRTPSEAFIASVDARGVMTPVIVKRLPDGTYAVHEGNKRIRAARVVNAARRKAGDEPIRVKSVPYSGKDTLSIALIGNYHRQDEDDVDAAERIRVYVEEMGHTEQDAADLMGRPLSWVRAHRALVTAAPAVQEAVRAGTLKPTAAAELVKGTPDHKEQAQALKNLSSLAPENGKKKGRVTVEKVRAAAKGEAAVKLPGKRAITKAAEDIYCRADDYGRGAAAVLRWILLGEPDESLRLEAP